MKFNSPGQVMQLCTMTGDKQQMADKQKEKGSIFDGPVPVD